MSLLGSLPPCPAACWEGSACSLAARHDYQTLLEMSQASHFETWMGWGGGLGFSPILSYRIFQISTAGSPGQKTDGRA